MKPHWLGMAGTVVTVGLLSNEPSLLQYSLAIIALTLTLNFWLAYMLGGVTRVDISGRYAVLTTAALGGGAMVGPAISGFVLQQSDMLQVLLVSLALIFAGFSGITMALRRFLQCQSTVIKRLITMSSLHTLPRSGASYEEVTRQVDELVEGMTPEQSGKLSSTAFGALVTRYKLRRKPTPSFSPGTRCLRFRRGPRRA